MLPKLKFPDRQFQSPKRQRIGSTSSPYKARSSLSFIDTDAGTLANRFRAAVNPEEAGGNLALFGDWFAQIADVLGSDKVLDEAAEAFISALADLRQGTQSASRLSTHETASRSVSDAVSDGILGKSPFTLIAVFLMLVLEVSPPIVRRKRNGIPG